MTVPDYQTLMLPLLELTSDGNEHTVAGLREPLADRFRLSEDDRKEKLPSGQQFRFHNRVAWAKIYLERAGLLETVRRGHFRLTERGRNVLAQRRESIDVSYLLQFSEFAEFRNKNAKDNIVTNECDRPAGSVTPEEALEVAIQQLQEDLATEILSQIRICSPSFFERLVIDVLLKMGYGGPGGDSGTVTSSGADGGIDGIINEDRLGLDVIYLQAKRWESTVSRPEIQKFVGALHGNRAKKGVFLTTSAFTREAVEYVRTIDPRVVLIDGRKLAQLMIEYNVGVNVAQSYQVKKIDSDYFLEE
jgi:restriction system protein